jgi:C1A family cysteine protease
MAFQIKGFGWKRDLNDVRDYTPESAPIKTILKGAKKTAKSPLPPSVDNRKWCTPVKDQGNLGSCTANAGVSMYEYMERKAYGSYGKSIEGSRLFVYKNTRLLMGREGWGDSGAYIRTTLGAMRLFGVPNEQYLPYDVERYDNGIDAFVYALGQNFQSIKHFRLDYSSVGVDNIWRMKEYLVKGYSMQIGFTVFESYKEAESNGGFFPFPKDNESPVGGHSVLVVGYNDDKNAFLIQNSWGESWGDKGFGWLPYGYFFEGANGDVLADDVWALTKVEWIQTGEFMI